MALTPEQVRALKDQLLSQIEHLPPEKRAEAEKQIEELTPQALELMLKQQTAKEQGKSPFRMIVDGEIPSKIIDENPDAIAVLEINPISKGHTIILSRKAARDAQELSNKSLALAKKISKKIVSKLKAKTAEIQTENKLGETIINIIPVYDIPLNINSPRQKAGESELDEVFSKLKGKREKKEKKQVIRKEAPSPAPENQVIKWHRKIP
ncbi:MAG: HIT domain-containing protein [archaeon]|jgi:diadenosine tetraphosphate (Ap4A) HIT family hydrolase|nr:HIT domain-containing protein [archaeon]